MNEWVELWKFEIIAGVHQGLVRDWLAVFCRLGNSSKIHYNAIASESVYLCNICPMVKKNMPNSSIQLNAIASVSFLENSHRARTKHSKVTSMFPQQRGTTKFLWIYIYSRQSHWRMATTVPLTIFVKFHTLICNKVFYDRFKLYLELRDGGIYSSDRSSALGCFSLEVCSPLLYRTMRDVHFHARTHQDLSKFRQIWESAKCATRHFHNAKILTPKSPRQVDRNSGYWYVQAALKWRHRIVLTLKCEPGIQIPTRKAKYFSPWRNANLESYESDQRSIS